MSDPAAEVPPSAVEKPTESTDVITSSTTNTVPTASGGATAAAARELAAPGKKTKYAVCFGYVGSNYSGLQWNCDPSHPTIELRLVEGLIASGLISPENAQGNTLEKVGWRRASRTDKGVSALRNIVSGKFMTPPNGDEEAAVDKLNQCLPSDICVYRLQRVTGVFDGYKSCTGRQYYYLLPTFALLNGMLSLEALVPSSHGGWNIFGDEDAQVQEKVRVAAAAAAAEAAGSDSATPGANGNFNKRPREVKGKPAGRNKTGEEEEEQLEGDEDAGGDDATAATSTRVGGGAPPPLTAEMLQRLYDFRVDAAVVERTRSLFQAYIGTKWFHNFTPKGRGEDMSMQRYLRSITVSEPFLVPVGAAEEGVAAAETTTKRKHDATIRSIEFVKVRLDGQSFMLNQIRRMVGAVIGALTVAPPLPLPAPDASATEAPVDPALRLIQALLNRKLAVNTPMAPANGLFLVGLDFATYDFALSGMRDRGQLKLVDGERQPMRLSEYHWTITAFPGEQERPRRGDETVGATTAAATGPIDAAKEELTPRDIKYRERLLRMEGSIARSIAKLESDNVITAKWLQTIRSIMKSSWWGSSVMSADGALTV